MKRLLIILLSLALLGVGGYLGWNYYQDSKTNNDPSEGGKYLVIKEWGVRFELPEELRGDVKYGIEFQPSGDQIAWFEVGSIASLPGSECRLTEAEGAGHSGKIGGIGALLVRTSEKIPDAETSYYYTPATNMRIGDYWFTGGRLRYSESCVNDENKVQLVLDTRASIVYAFERLE